MAEDNAEYTTPTGPTDRDRDKSIEAELERTRLEIINAQNFLDRIAGSEAAARKYLDAILNSLRDRLRSLKQMSRDSESGGDHINQH